MIRTAYLIPSLFIGAILLAMTALILPDLPIFRILALVLILNGYIAVLQMMGLDRPLNRTAAILSGFASVGALNWSLTPSGADSFAILYVLSFMAAFLMTSIALVHRKGTAQFTGLIGIVATSMPIVVFVAGHIVIGGFGLLSVRWWNQANQTEALLIWPAELIIAAAVLVLAVVVSRISTSPQKNLH